MYTKHLLLKQHHTERNMAIPVGMTDQELAAYGATRPVNGRGRHYPRVYNNEEENPVTQGVRPNFHDWETRGNMLAEFPATNNAQYDFDRRATNLNRVRNVEINLNEIEEAYTLGSLLMIRGRHVMSRELMSMETFTTLLELCTTQRATREALIEHRSLRLNAKVVVTWLGTWTTIMVPAGCQHGPRDAADLTRREANYRRARR